MRRSASGYVPAGTGLRRSELMPVPLSFPPLDFVSDKGVNSLSRYPGGLCNRMEEWEMREVESLERLG